MALHQHPSAPRPLSIATCIVAALFAALPSVAQRTTPQSRITAAIDNSRRASLIGSRSPRATAATDVGAVAPDMPLQGITLVFSQTPAQKTALDALAASQQNPFSPMYHRWLKPEQFAAQFGVADADIATVSSWLERQGFAVRSVSRSRNRISFSGTAGQVAGAFGAPLHYYQAKGEASSHMAPSADLSVPSALGSVVLSVSNLSTFRPHSNAVLSTSRPQPQYTAGGDQVAYLVPPDIATIYDVNPAYGAGHNGNGQTIAVVGQSAVLPLDLANFQTALGVPIQPQVLNLIPGTGTSAIVSGDEIESDLDLEYASAMAPGATVSLYYVGTDGFHNAFDSIVYVIDNDLAGIISVSYAACEPDMGSWGIDTLDLSLEQAAVQGQTIIAASGDHGSISCQQSFSDPPAIQQTPAVEFPASSPWVVGIGGTQFPQADLGDPVNPTYWASSPDDHVLSSALSYIPEQVWNDAGGGVSEGGGGTSIFEPQPAWQVGVPGISAAGFRLVPDISLNSSDMQPGYLMCSSDPAFGSTDNCTDGFHNVQGQGWDVIGGTSVATPIFAGMVAVLNEAKGYTAGQGLINPTLYTLASDPSTYATAFHDITDGNNGCTDKYACTLDSQGTDYVAGVGYDEASGLGSIDFAVLLSAWPQNTTTTAVATTTTLNVSSQNLQYGVPLTLTATVSSGMGSVSFFSKGTLLGAATLNSVGVASLVPLAAYIQPGANYITAAYGGNTGYEPSASDETTVNVTTAPTTTMIATSSTTAAFGSNVTFTTTITTNGSPMPGLAYVQYRNNGQLLGNSLVGEPPNGITTFSLSTLPVGADSITVSFNGTTDYSASTSTATVVNVGPAVTATTVTSSTINPIYGSPVTLTATVSAAGVPAPSGVVTFSNGGVSIGTALVSNGVASMSLSSLSVGNDSIAASYGGTSSFGASASAALVLTVTAAPTTTSLSSSTTSATFGGPVTLTATVHEDGSTATSGTVSFLNGASVLGTGTVSGGTATLLSSNLPVGADSITAAYGGTSNFGASASSAVTVNVTAGTTTTTIGSSTTTPSFGSNVTLTATVSLNGSPATSGVVTFLSGGTSVATGAVNSSGLATINIASLPVGIDSITAAYGGTSNFAPSASDAVLVSVAPGVTRTVLRSSSPSPAYGANVTLTATVVNTNNPVSGGTVSFLSNGLPIGAATVTEGLALLSLSTLPVGANSISVSYTGTSNFAASTSTATIVTVSLDQTTTTLSASSMNPAFGSNVTLTATVEDGSSPATSGTVTFLEGGSAIGTGIVINGVATLNLTTLPIGANQITAGFAGGSSLSNSTSTPVIVTVSLDPTTTTLGASSATAVYGSSVAFTATVSNGSSPATSGTVTFLNGGSAIGTGTVINGVATLNLTTLPIGANQISASFAGTLNLAASASSTVLVTVTSAQVNTATTLISSSTTPVPGDSVIFTATVTSNGAPVTSGTVNFLNGGTLVGSETLNNGVALMSLTTLPTGANSITASFTGISGFAASASNAVIVTVTVPVTEAPPVIAVSAPPPATPGGVVTTTATFSAGASYSGTMKLTCKLTGPPAGAQSVPTCSFNPSTLVLSPGGSGTAVLAVQTTAASTSSQARTSGLNLWGLGAGGSALAGLMMFCFPSRRRRLLSSLAVLIVSTTVGFTGCGGGSGNTAPPITSPATTPGAYLFTVTGTDVLNPGITTSAVVSVTVE